LEYPGGAFPTIVAEAGGLALGEAAAPDRIRLVNRASAETGFIIESRAWVADALTAHKATTLQAFRDLLPEQTLRPDEDVAIDNVTLLFTDLAGSTALYERIG